MATEYFVRVSTSHSGYSMRTESESFSDLLDKILKFERPSKNKLHIISIEEVSKNVAK